MSCGQCFECDNCVVYCPQIGGGAGAEEGGDDRALRVHRLRQVHRLPHLQGRVPDRLHPDGARRIARMARSAAPSAAASGARALRLRWRCSSRCAPGAALAGACGRRARRARRACRSRWSRSARRRQVRRGHAVHAAQSHGAPEAPARPDGARRRAHDAAQPRQLRDLPREQGDGPRHRQQGRVLRRLPHGTPRSSSTASNAIDATGSRARGRRAAASVRVGRSAGRASAMSGIDHAPAADPRLGRGDGRRHARARHHAVRPRARPSARRSRASKQCAGACWSTSTAARPTATPA